MKTKSILVLACLAMTVMVRCSGQKKDESSQTTESKTSSERGAPQFQVAAAFQQQLGDVFTSYVGLKDAFVASDANKVKQAAQATTQAVGRVDMSLLSGAAHQDWMTYLGAMQTSLKEIETTSDIEGQRKAFSMLSDNFYKTIKAFGLGGKEAFYEFCPMAFNNEGAFWISEQAKIKNPYFGDMMLTCGVVKEKLK